MNFLTFFREACAAVEKSFASDASLVDESDVERNNSRIQIKRILSALKGHLSLEVLGSVCAAYFNDGGPRFICSHTFTHIMLHQTVSFFKDEEMTGLMKTMSQNQEKKEKFIYNDVQLKDYIHRPVSLENMCQYDFYCHYQRVSSNRFLKFLDSHPLAHSHSLKRLIFEQVPTVSHRLGMNYYIEDEKEIHCSHTTSMICSLFYMINLCVGNIRNLESQDNTSLEESEFEEARENYAIYALGNVYFFASF